jgi:hypothetical protein
MEAKEKPGILYIWRSLIRGIRAMEKGMIWRVVMGHKFGYGRIHGYRWV